MAAEKFVHGISPTLSHDAQFRTVAEIPSAMLTQGSTLRYHPGAYSAETVNLDKVSIEGVGNREDIVITGLTLGTSSANTMSIRGVSLVTFNNTGNGAVVIEDCVLAGSNAVINLATPAVELGEAGVVSMGTMTILRSRFNACDIGIRSHSEGDITLSYVDAKLCDRTLLSNGNAIIEVCTLNAIANAYFTPGGTSSFAPNVAVFSSSSGGSNTGNTSETIRGLIS